MLSGQGNKGATMTDEKEGEQWLCAETANSRLIPFYSISVRSSYFPLFPTEIVKHVSNAHCTDGSYFSWTCEHIEKYTIFPIQVDFQKVKYGFKFQVFPVFPIM